MKRFSKKKKPQRTESMRQLVENNNISLQEGSDLAGSENIITPNNNNNEEKPPQISEQISLEGLAEVLGLASDEVDEVFSSEVTSDLQRSSSVHLIRKSVHKNFPKPPTDLDKMLHVHLENVQNTVQSELQKLQPLLDVIGLSECLSDCYHRKTFAHLHDLLQSVNSPQSCLKLIDWVLNSYMSPDLIVHSDLQHSVKKLDPFLSSDWMAKAQKRLLENVLVFVRAQLENILENQKTEGFQDGEEAFVSLYIYTINCINAPPKQTERISSVLSAKVQEVCFMELLVFLDRYTEEQTEALSKEAKKDNPKMWHFFKTFKTCEELRKHVLSKESTLKGSILQDIMLKLENLENVTLNLLLKTVADLAETQFQTYFKTTHNRLLFFTSALQATFPEIQNQEMPTKVLDEVYKLIVNIYLKHLLGSSLKKLRRLWTPNVDQAVYEDAKLLHLAMTELAPGVQEGNCMLLEVVEMLECTDIDALKITVASMEKCQTQSDVDLLPKLLQWKGLSGRKVREVLDVIPGRQTRPVSCFSWLTCFW